MSRVFARDSTEEAFDPEVGVIGEPFGAQGPVAPAVNGDCRVDLRHERSNCPRLHRVRFAQGSVQFLGRQRVKDDHVGQPDDLSGPLLNLTDEAVEGDVSRGCGSQNQALSVRVTQRVNQFVDALNSNSGRVGSELRNSILQRQDVHQVARQSRDVHELTAVASDVQLEPRGLALRDVCRELGQPATRAVLFL